MWFVGVLLVFSLRPGGLAPLPAARLGAGGPLRPRHLAAAALVVGAATFLVRIALPVDSNQPLNSHLWAWPEYVALFALGVIAARHGWLRPVPQDISRPAGITTLVAIVLLGAMVLSTDPLGLTEENWLGGWGLPALAAALLEGVVVIAAPVWVLSFAQRRLNGTGPIRRAMARSSYAAFMLQGPVIVGLELAFRPAPLPGDLKAVLVACLGIAVSFTLAYPLVTRTPLRKVLEGRRRAGAPGCSAEAESDHQGAVEFLQLGASQATPAPHQDPAGQGEQVVAVGRAAMIESFVGAEFDLGDVPAEPVGHQHAHHRAQQGQGRVAGGDDHRVPAHAGDVGLPDLPPGDQRSRSARHAATEKAARRSIRSSCSGSAPE